MNKQQHEEHSKQLRESFVEKHNEGFGYEIKQTLGAEDACIKSSPKSAQPPVGKF